MLTINRYPFLAYVLVIHTVDYKRIKYLLCQGLFTTNLAELLNKHSIKID